VTAATALAAGMPQAFAQESIVIESFGLEEMNTAAQSAGIDYSSLLSGLLSGSIEVAANTVKNMLGSAAAALTHELSRIAAAIAVPLAVSLIMRVLVQSGPGRRSVSLIARISVMSTLATTFAELVEAANAMFADITRLTGLMSPALIAAASMTGAASAAAMVSPMTAVCVEIVQKGFARYGISACVFSAVVSIAGSISESIRLRRLHTLAKKMLEWITGTLMAVFFAALTLQGKLSSGMDKMSVRTARYAAENLIPIIGGNVSDSMDSLLLSAEMVRNAIGISGLVILSAVFAAPILRLAGMMLLLRFASSIAEPLGDDSIAQLTAQFSEAVQMLMVVSLAVFLLCAMVTGSCLWTVNRVAGGG